MSLRDVTECDVYKYSGQEVVWKAKKSIHEMYLEGTTDMIGTIASECTIARFNSNLYNMFDNLTLTDYGVTRKMFTSSVDAVGHNLVCLIANDDGYGYSNIPMFNPISVVDKNYCKSSDGISEYSKSRMEQFYDKGISKLIGFNPNSICLHVRCYPITESKDNPVNTNTPINPSELANAKIGVVNFDIYAGTTESRTNINGFLRSNVSLCIIDIATMQGYDDKLYVEEGKTFSFAASKFSTGNELVFTTVYKPDVDGNHSATNSRFNKSYFDYEDMEYIEDSDGNRITYVSWGTVSSIISKLGFYYTPYGDKASSAKIGEGMTDSDIYFAGKDKDGHITNDIYTGADIPSHNPFINDTDISDIPNDYTPYDPGSSEPTYDPNTGQYNEPIKTNGLGMGLSTGFSSWYLMDYNMVSQMAMDLWNADDSKFEQIINGLRMLDNPMDFITSLKMYPFELNKIHITTSPSVSIYAGRSELETAIGLPIHRLVGYIDFGELYVYDYYSNYLSVEPYSTCEIYLPFIGVQTISLKDCIRSWLNLEYYIDLTTGTVTALLLSTKKEGSEIVSQNQILTASGIISVDIPVTGNNNSRTAQAITSAFVGGAENTIGNASKSENAVGAVGSLVTGAVNTAYNTYTSSAVHPSTIGTATSLSWSCLPKEPYLIFSKPNPLETHSFGESHGYMYNDRIRLSNCSGFVKCENVHFENATNETIITSEEYKMIKDIMEGGFYV